MKQPGLILIEKRGSDAVTFRWIAPLNIPATCNFFCESCQWESFNDNEVFQKKIIEKPEDDQHEYF